jgi:hypothetical protein
MAQQNITPNSPPIVWSTVDEAFQKINANFVELYLSIGGSGADLSGLASSIIPDANALRNLGSEERKWNEIWATELNLGTAVITATGETINLPVGSTIGGLRVDESYFKTIAVSGQDSVVADEGTDTLTLSSGTGVSIATNATTDTITFSNTGVTAAAAGTGIGVSAATGNVTFSNTGVVNAVAGNGIGVSSATGNVTISNTGVRQLVAGSGIVLDATTGIVTVSNSAPNVAQNVYRFIAVSGQSTLDPAGPLSTLNLLAGPAGLSITTDPANNRVTFTNTGVTNISVDDAFNISSGTGSVNVSLKSTIQRNIEGDITGSVFADDSTMLIDATEGRIVGPVFANVTGDIQGSVGVFTNSVTVGAGVNGILSTTGNDVYLFNTASGAKLGLVVREGILNKTVLEINSTAKTIALDNTYTVTGFVGTVTGNIFTNLIDSADSSAITVTPKTIFSSDVDVENELRIQGKLVINVAQLKSIVAASADFAEFKNAIAALTE